MLFATTPASFAATSTSHTIYASGTMQLFDNGRQRKRGPAETTIFATITDTLTGTLKVTYVGVIVFYVYVEASAHTNQAEIDTELWAHRPRLVMLWYGLLELEDCVVGGGVEGTAHFSDGTGGLKGIHGQSGLRGRSPH